MKITQTLRLDQDQEQDQDNNNWEELAHATLRDAVRNNIHVESIHISGSEILIEGTHSSNDETDIL